MDRNLGATRVATSSTDAAAYGDLYQWGRAGDGHQKRSSGFTETRSSGDKPGHGNFIRTQGEPYDWRNPKNDNLWQGINGINNPCPTGYRLPTESEWKAEVKSWKGNDNAYGAFTSPLKLTLAGYRDDWSSSLKEVGSQGLYWSSTINSEFEHGKYMHNLTFDGSFALIPSNYRSFGCSVRCIKDQNGVEVAGNKLKEIGIKYWTSPNNDATIETVLQHFQVVFVMEMKIIHTLTTTIFGGVLRKTKKINLGVSV